MVEQRVFHLAGCLVENLVPQMVTVLVVLMVVQKALLLAARKAGLMVRPMVPTMVGMSETQWVGLLVVKLGLHLDILMVLM